MYEISGMIPDTDRVVLALQGDLDPFTPTRKHISCLFDFHVPARA
ncbi:MAG: hypothetical protein Q6353_000380 [Candidatus Sigynarchaeum springense]